MNYINTCKQGKNETCLQFFLYKSKMKSMKKRNDNYKGYSKYAGVVKNMYHVKSRFPNI